MELGRLGIWSGGLRTADLAPAQNAARELEELGYGTLWLPGRDPSDVEPRVRALLAATHRIVVATGILSIWTIDAGEAAALWRRLEEEFPGRFLLGLGVSHQPSAPQYRRPLTAMREYLDRLDDDGVPPERRILAALAPRMLELARERTLGTHPYLVALAHVERSRAAVGPNSVVASELTVVLDDDPTRARAAARRFLEGYLRLPNYAENLLRAGFEPDDVAGTGSDALVDAVVAWGDVDAIGARAAAYRTSGADHVALQVIGDEPLPLDAWRRLAPLTDA